MLLLLLSFVFFLSLLVFFLFLLLLLLLLSLSSLLLLLLRLCCVTGFVVVVVAFATTLIVVELKEGSTVCSSEVQKRWGVRGREKAAKCAVQKRGAGLGGWGGGAHPPLSANLPLMTLFSSLLPPKAISCGFSILCVGEEAFTHLFVLQTRLSFALLCFHAFLLPSEYVWLSPSCLSVKTFHS